MARWLLLGYLGLAAASAVDLGLTIEDEQEFAELGLSRINATLLLQEDADGMSHQHKGRQLAEEKKPKRKSCNTSAYHLKGDYAYEACGSFCKEAKAINQ